MISPLFSHLLVPFLVAMFLAVNMGGSGTAPAFSAAYGANIIRKSLIPDDSESWVAKLGFKNIFRKTEVNELFAMWIVVTIIAFGLSLLLIYLADRLELL